MQVTCWIARERAVVVPLLTHAECVTGATTVWTAREPLTVPLPTIHAECVTEATTVWTVRVRRTVPLPTIPAACVTAQAFPREHAIALETRWTVQARVVEEPPLMPAASVEETTALAQVAWTRLLAATTHRPPSAIRAHVRTPPHPCWIAWGIVQYP